MLGAGREEALAMKAHILIRCVEYEPELAVTLPAWKALLPDASVVVLTDRKGLDRPFDGITELRTDAWRSLGPSMLNGGAAVREALATIPEGDTIISADADAYPVGNLAPRPEPNAIYGCARYDCLTRDVLNGHLEGRISRDELGLIPQRGKGRELIYRADLPTIEKWAARCLGYFQMWRHSPKVHVPDNPRAGGYDRDLAKSFERRVGLTDFYVMHLGERSKENWTGRVLPPWGMA